MSNFKKLLSLLLCTSLFAIHAQDELVQKDASTRAISIQTNVNDHGIAKIAYKATAIDQATNTMYATSPDGDNKQGSFVKINQSNDDPQAITVTSLAPEKATVNGTADTNNPLYNKRSYAVALAGSSSTQRLGAIDFDNAQKLVTINNLSDSSAVSQSANLVGPSGNATAGIQAIAGTKNTTPQFFALVTNDATKNWTSAGLLDSNRGITVISLNENELKQMSSADITKTLNAKALALAITGTSHVVASCPDGTTARAVFQNYDALNQSVNVHWNENLQRLFIGFDRLAINDDDITAAKQPVFINSVVVAGIDKTDNNKLFVKSIVDHFDTKAANIFSSNGQNMIGTRSKNGSGGIYGASTHKINTMHTSTNKDYLIINGGTTQINDDPEDINNVNAWVYALPIMPAGHANAGQLAQASGSDDFSVLAADLAAIDPGHTINNFEPTERAYVIGAGPGCLGSGEVTETIHDMHVIGDTVYVSIAAGEPALIDGNIGIYQSTALFDTDGLIVNWTPWQKVSGYNDTNHQPTKFMFNTDNGGFIFLGKNDEDEGSVNQLCMNIWGTAAEAYPEEDAIHVLNLSSLFDDNKGIFKLFIFDENTPGFDDTNKISLLIALAGNKVVIKTTGINERGLDDSSYTLTDDLLTEIAPLTSVAFVHDTNVGNSGCLLIGGLNGLVRVRKIVDDETVGYEDLSALSDLFNEDRVLEKIDGFTEVIDLKPVFSGRGCAVTTLKKLSVIKASDADAPETIMKDVDGDTIELVLTKPFILNTVVTDSLGIIATTQGVAGLDWATGSPLDNLPQLKGSPLQLLFVSNARTSAVAGTLYILTGDRNKGTGFIYRLAINDTTITLIDKDDENNINPYKELNQFFHSFFVDNHIIYLTRSEETDNTDKFYMLINTNNDTDAMVVLDDQLNITSTTDKTFIGQPMRVSSTGNMIVPGSFGIRINN